MKKKVKNLYRKGFNLIAEESSINQIDTERHKLAEDLYNYVYKKYDSLLHCRRKPKIYVLMVLEGLIDEMLSGEFIKEAFTGKLEE